MIIERLKLFLLILGVIVTASIEHITIPIFVTAYSSIYFILLMTTVQGTIFYAIGFGILRFIKDEQLPNVCDNLGLIIMAGVTNALMSMFLAYSANPIRTPVVIQSIFLGLAIIPSIVFTKFILKKNVEYNKVYASLSISLLLLSVTIACIPIFLNNNNTFHVGWIVLYLFGVVFLSLANILQEKYIIMTNHSLLNKFRFAAIVSFVQVVTIILCCWIDLFFGYYGTPAGAFNAFVNSIDVFFSDPYMTFLIELFVIDILALFIFSIYLNAISTNYNMILTNLTNQSVALFFLFFPELNHGLKYPLSVTMLSLTFNISSIILWVKGEKTIEEKSIETPYNTF